MDATWRPIAEAVMEPRFGDLLGELNDVRNLGGPSGESYVDKDLRTLLGETCAVASTSRYCGERLARRVPRIALGCGRFAPPTTSPPSSAATIRRAGADRRARTGFVPGLLPTRFPTTNRPTFQQVLEFQHRSR